MSILQEKNTRYYFTYMMCLIGFLFLWIFFLSWFHGKETQHLIFEREQTMVSSLMEQGVDQTSIARALKDSAATREGVELLQRLGHTENASVRIFPSIDNSVQLFWGITAAMAGILAFLLLGITVRFLRQQENLYQKAEGIIAQFSTGNFQNHLPQNETGRIYQLFAAVEELAAALRAQSENEQHMKAFLKDTISDISHQLKTPLAALQMYTEIISQEPEHVDTVKRFADKTMQSLERIEQLVQALLKVSRIDAGSIVFQKKNQTVSELVTEAMGDLSVRAQKEGKQIVIRGDPEAELLCDRQWTREAVANLIKNALDHTGDGGIVTISWESSPAVFRLVVTDDGCGISEEDIHHIFKRFYRSQGNHNRQGIGLGLPLAKSIVEGQGGILSVSSTPGEGSVFTMSFLTDL